MSPVFSVDTLMARVRDYYPLGIASGDPRHEGSAETQRLRQLLRTEVIEPRAWQGFVQQVETRFPLCEVSATGPRLTRPSYRCEVTLSGMEPWPDRTREDSVVCMLSVIAPVYALYAHHWKDDRTERESWTRFPPLPPEFHAYEEGLAALLQSVFGFTRLPNGVLFTPVPDLHPLKSPPHSRAAWLQELLFG
jgi:hypothetical protein